MNLVEYYFKGVEWYSYEEGKSVSNLGGGPWIKDVNEMPLIVIHIQGTLGMKRHTPRKREMRDDVIKDRHQRYISCLKLNQERIFFISTKNYNTGWQSTLLYKATSLRYY